MSEAVDGEVMEEGWWHPVQCSNVHNESGNCIDADGAIVGWRERRLTRVADPREVGGLDLRRWSDIDFEGGSDDGSMMAGGVGR